MPLTFDQKMCLHPKTIPNPNKGLNPNIGLNYLKDCTASYITIPCHHCKECYANMQMQIVQRVQMECINQHCFFCTLTYNNEQIPQITLPNNKKPEKPYNIRYTDYADLNNMFKRLRKDNAFGREFRYFAVSELGSKRARPHAHILFFIPKEKTDTFGTLLNLEKKMFNAVLKEWRRNYGSKRVPDYQPLCTYIRRWTKRGLSTTYDLHWCNPATTEKGIADVGFYVTKYMTKPSERAERLQQALHLNLEEEEYEKIWSKVKPKEFHSLGFGLNPKMNPKTHKIEEIDKDILAYLKKCVSDSIKRGEEYPKYKNPHTGEYFPLARYYYQFGEIFDWKDATSLYFNSDKKSRSEQVQFDERDRRTLKTIDNNFEKHTQKLIEANQTNFDEFF